MAAHDDGKTAYPNSFRVNLEDKQSQLLEDVSEATRKPKSSIVRDAIEAYCRRILSGLKVAKKTE